jgi:hypothetical protein
VGIVVFLVTGIYETQACFQIAGTCIESQPGVRTFTWPIQREVLRVEFSRIEKSSPNHDCKTCQFILKPVFIGPAMRQGEQRRADWWAWFGSEFFQYREKVMNVLDIAMSRTGKLCIVSDS